VGCKGMAAHVFRKRKAPHALFIMYVAPDAPPSVVYHEALHLTHMLMDYTGMPIDYESTETQAYTMEHIATAALGKITPERR